MLPKFPNFKRLELSDQEDVERITSQYEPYSDFDFPSMWCWDVNDNTMVSELNGNLVAILSDHFTGTPFYSFLGNNDLDKTLKQLFAFSVHGKNSMPQLKLVPEISLEKINLKKFLIEIDLSNYDYIYDLKKISEYTGTDFSDKRRKLNNFLKNHDNPVIKILNLNDSADVQEILNLNDSWTAAKIRKDEGSDLKKEFIAIDRFIKAQFKGTLCVAVYVEEKLAGYAIFSVLPNSYSICHFSKGDIAHYGVYEFLLRESATILIEKGSTLLNYQEDLGLPGLRFWKNSFKPVSFLRKYFIREL